MAHTVDSLMEKIIEARLIAKQAMKSHADRCVVEMDPEGYAPCNCGATAANNALQEVIDKLKL